MHKYILLFKKVNKGIFMVVQWLRLQASIAEGAGSIAGSGTKIPYAMQHGKKKKKEREKCFHGKVFFVSGSLFPLPHFIPSVLSSDAHQNLLDKL